MAESKKSPQSKPPRAKGEVWLNDPSFKQGREYFSYWSSLPGTVRISLLLLD